MYARRGENMLSITCKRAIRFLAFVGLSMFGAASAQAGFTHVNTNDAPAPGQELGHAGIFSNTYGGTFVANGVNYSNGSVTATRCEDFGNNYADGCWNSLTGDISARAIARYAGYQQSLGIFDGESGGSLSQLFTVVGEGLSVTGSADVHMSSGAFRFARAGGGDEISGVLATSLALDNIMGQDQMVSYHLTGPGGLNRYVLFFEDLTAAQNSDWDFNDLVVEIRGASAGVVAVPLPPAVWSGLTVLLTGGVLSARGRIMRWFR
jgi:hypothetical protein